MIDFIVRIVINAAALIVAAIIVPGIHLTVGSKVEDWLKIAAVALIFGLINTYLRPIVRALTLPISLITMGLVGLIINAVMLLILSFASGGLKLPFKVANFPPQLDANAFVAAFLGGIIISIVATVLSLALGTRKVFGRPL